MENQSIFSPLVSIVIITYNSANYILETLESVKNQIYTNIELIISDDFSTDRTVPICEQWLQLNNHHFVNTKLVKTNINTGVAPNCNRGIKEGKGTWFKLCAGDDLLLPNCISANIDFVLKNQKSKIVISNMLVFLDNTSPLKVVEIRKPLNKHYYSEDVLMNDQYEKTIQEYFGNTISYFISSEVFSKVKFDESIPFIEDYAFALNAMKNGFKVIYNDIDTVMYRIGTNSVSNPTNNLWLYNSFYKTERNFNLIYRYPFLPSKIRKRENFEYNRKILLEKLHLNRKNLFCRAINFITIRINPYRFM